MTRPADVPEDVWAAAEAAGEAVYGRHERGFVMWPLTDAETLRPAIARAILAERERCAQLAGAELRNTGFLMSNPPKSAAAWEIRNAIRAGATHANT